MDTGLLCYLVADMNAAIHIDPEIHWSHDFWNSCTRCGGLNTHQTNVRYTRSGVATERHCNVCGHDWGTEVFGDDDDYGHYDSDDGYNFDDGDDYEAALADCGMTRDGFCMLAGTEHCDWDCPINWDDPEMEGVFIDDDESLDDQE
jgi:hypothetical protein